MKLQNFNTDPGQSASPLNWLDETVRSGLTDRQMFVMLHHYKKRYGDAALPEAEIRQKIEIELAFQGKLVSAFEREGYFAEDVGENETRCDLFSWRCFRVRSKDVTIPFLLRVWLFSDKSALPRVLGSISKGWRALGGDDVGESGSSEAKELEGVSFDDATSPHRCHFLLVMDDRLRFETLPLLVMRDTLLGDHLAEELASKVALAFDRIRTITAERVRLLELQMPNDIKRIVADHHNMFLPVSSTEACRVAMFLCRKLAGMTLPLLAERFCRPLSAVIYACKVVEYRMQGEPMFLDTVIQIVRELGYKYEIVEDWSAKDPVCRLPPNY